MLGFPQQSQPGIVLILLTSMLPSCSCKEALAREHHIGAARYPCVHSAQGSARSSVLLPVGSIIATLLAKLDGKRFLRDEDHFFHLFPLFCSTAQPGNFVSIPCSPFRTAMHHFDRIPICKPQSHSSCHVELERSLPRQQLLRRSPFCKNTQSHALCACAHPRFW